MDFSEALSWNLPSMVRDTRFKFFIKNAGVMEYALLFKFPFRVHPEIQDFQTEQLALSILDRQPVMIIVLLNA